MKNNFFKKIGLERPFKLELPMTLDSFKDIFRRKVGKTSSVIGFGYSKTEFQGTLEGNKFKIWSSVSIYQKNNAATYASIERTNTGLTIRGETRIPTTIFFTYLILGLLFNIIVLTLAISEAQLHEQLDILILMLTVVFAFTFIGPYFWFRRNVKQFSKDIEKELYLWTKSYISQQKP